MLVKNIMTQNPITVLPSDKVTATKALMTSNNISKLPVLDKDNRLVGIITKNDIASSSPSSATTLDMFEISYLLSKLTVDKVMKKKVITIEEEEVIETAAKTMAEHKISSLVVTHNSIVTGIITKSDIFKLFVSIFSYGSKGVRASLLLDDKPGVTLGIMQELARRNANIISLMTQESHAKEKRLITIKVANISLEDFNLILNKLNLTPEDIRVI